MKLSYFFKEVIRGKTIGRAILAASLKNVFEKDGHLNENLEILELGSEPASHQRVLPKKWKIAKSNINDAGDPDYVFDANEKFPFESEFFDGVIFFNTIYAIENQENCLKESLRVSKKIMIFNAPLISGLAHHPHDFHRYTRQGLEKTIKSLGLKSYKIIPIGGSFSSGVPLVDNYLRYRIIRAPLYLLAIFLDKIDKVMKKECPLQYIVVIKK